jgi:hypothetical protein
MCSASYFRNHPSPHVLPLDSDLAEKNVIPLDESDEVSSIIPPKTTSRGQSTTQEETTGSRFNRFDAVYSQESSLEEKVTVLNESVRDMVNCNLIDEDVAYRFLSTKISELTRDTT